MYLNVFTHQGLRSLLVGLGVEKMEKQAIALFEKAADRDDPNGMRNLGLAYSKGDGVRQDDRKAIEM